MLLVCQGSQPCWAVGTVTDSRSIADLAGTLIEPLTPATAAPQR